MDLQESLPLQDIQSLLAVSPATAAPSACAVVSWHICCPLREGYPTKGLWVRLANFFVAALKKFGKGLESGKQIWLRH